MRFFIIAFALGCSAAETGAPVVAADAATDVPVVAADAATDVPVVAADAATDVVDDSAKVVSAVTFRDVYAQVLSSSCSSPYCHGGTAGGWSVKDSEDATYEQLVGPKSTACAGLDRVTAGAPEKSAFFIKVRGDFTDLCNGKRMPPGGALTAEQLEIVRAWIAAGAPR